MWIENCFQSIVNSVSENPTISPIFATVLVQYLLECLDDMGSDVVKSNLHLRLFKLVFCNVSLFSAENEHMLRPNFRQTVNRSIDLAKLSANKPYNYFFFLRGLFGSIGGALTLMFMLTYCHILQTSL